jgi:hypothetical protein
MKTISKIMLCAGMVALMGTVQGVEPEPVNAEREKRLKIRESTLKLHQAKKARLLLIRQNQQRQQQIRVQKKRQALMHEQQARDRQRKIQLLALKHQNMATVEQKRQETLKAKRAGGTQ